MTSTTDSSVWTRREVTTPGGDFIVHEIGEGSSTVLYLHDEISAGPDALALQLAKTHRVLAPVHPGFADASRPEWVESIRDVVEHYVELLSELKLGPETVVIGSSMGGWIATELTLRLNGQIRGLVLIDPVGLHVPGHYAADFWYVRDRDDILFSRLDAMPEVSPDEQVANEESAARYGWTPRLYDPTLGPRTHRLTAPTLLVWAQNDRLLPREHLAAWQEAIASSTVTEIADSGHFPNYEQPEATYAAIEGFLDELSPVTGDNR